jgi:hypothetical protein
LQQKGFFAAQALPAKRPEPRAAIILPRFARFCTPSAKTCYALSNTQGLHCSDRFHPKLFCCEKTFSFKHVIGRN